MALLIKICGLTHVDAVRAAIDAGADAVGFVFAESVRQVTPRQATEMASVIPADVLRVAVMRHPSAELWTEVESIFCPDVIQTDIEDFQALRPAGNIKAWPVIRQGTVPEPLSEKWPETFLYEGQQSGSGKTADWEEARTLARNGQLILAGGLNPLNVAKAIAAVDPYGVDVSSGVEYTPGKKDPHKIAAFVAAARAAVDKAE